MENFSSLNKDLSTEPPSASSSGSASKRRLPIKILHIDDEEDYTALIRDILSTTEIDSCNSFLEGLDKLKSGDYDLIILDVRDGSPDHPVSREEEAGRVLLEAIKRTCFIPVVFLTGLPHTVTELSAPPLIQVLAKDGEPTEIEATIKDAIDSGLPALRRRLEFHFRDVFREYMWDFVAPNFLDFSADNNYTYLLLRRLSLSITSSVGKDLGIDLNPPQVPTARYYVIPPVESLRTGDIFSADFSRFVLNPSFYLDSVNDSEKTSFWVVTTPTCDLTIQRNGKSKATNVIFARATNLKSLPEFKKLTETSFDKAKGSLKSLMLNRRQKHQESRFHYLPAAFSIPHLVVDFQQIVSIPREALDKEDVIRIASLDTPYGEELIARFTNYFNRIGSPDLNIDEVLESLVSKS